MDSTGTLYLCNFWWDMEPPCALDAMCPLAEKRMSEKKCLYISEASKLMFAKNLCNEHNQNIFEKKYHFVIGLGVT